MRGGIEPDDEKLRGHTRQIRDSADRRCEVMWCNNEKLLRKDALTNHAVYVVQCIGRYDQVELPPHQGFGVMRCQSGPYGKLPKPC